ncbi:hypothetical protein OH76DRAFT_1421220 [Lentinus brumalis]|uniref:F-box domain-containing protein n=1 Tax=Lentinus brumalis TaxID=2498619 RepID=A0A371CWT1_9APHY|nr:hypothetical protein OH76DRAFT_1421220 [Polyporus brumalis]
MHNRLPKKLQLRICQLLDMRTLLRLRRCSNQYLELVSNELTESLEQRLAPYVPFPDALLINLIDRDAFVGGHVALQFLLRDPADDVEVPGHLDLYVPAEQVDAVVHHLETRQGGSVVEFPPPEGCNMDDWLEEHSLLEVVAVETTAGLVYVHRAQGEDALAPIARSWSTLHMCYANGVLFGCAFPGLTFDRRGLVGDMSSEDEDVRLCAAYLAKGFDLRMSASSWEEYGAGDGTIVCCAPHWCCHAQPRRFDDPGALRCKVRMDIDAACIAPTWVTWRLDIRPCGGDCLRDGELEGWQVIELD